jgi:RHS repeat-associated protein
MAAAVSRWQSHTQRGSITSVTDNSGAVLAMNRYDGAAGVAQQHHGLPASKNLGRFGYTGHMWIPEISMWYARARIYSPTLGRFLQTDPIGYGDGMNMYAYVGGDPVNYTDPLGLARLTCRRETLPSRDDGETITVNSQLV